MSALLPAVESRIREFGLVFKVFSCDPDFADTAEFCKKYGFSEDAAANSILIEAKLPEIVNVVCLVLATMKLDVNNRLKNLLGAKRASFARAEVTKQLTGMELGGVTILGITNMPIYVDSQVLTKSEIVLGGGDRSSKAILSPIELKKLPNLQFIEGLAIIKN